MGAYKQITQTFQKEWKGLKDKDYNYDRALKDRALDYRNDDRAIVKLEKPTNIPTARTVGYKAKQGIFVARVRVRKGHGVFKRPKNKRKPRNMGLNKITRMKSIRSMAEERASKHFENAEVLGSYKIAEDGQKHYFEIVLVDRNSTSIVNDKNYSWLVHGQKGRAERGKTFAGNVNKKFNKMNTRKRRAKGKLDFRFG